jgi:hypothetical protein
MRSHVTWLKRLPGDARIATISTDMILPVLEKIPLSKIVASIGARAPSARMPDVADESDRPKPTVFLSYASEDREAARA